MQNVVAWAGAVAASTLLAVQAVLVCLRTRSCVRRSVPLLLAGFLVLAAFRPLLPPASAAAEAGLIALSWSAGAFLIRASRAQGFGAWTAASISGAFTVLVAHALGFERTLPYLLLQASITVGLASAALALLWAMRKRVRSGSAMATFAAGCACLAAGGVRTAGDLLGFPSPDPVVDAALQLAFCLCTGWLVFQEGWPERPGWGGGLPSLKSRQPQEPALYSRLLAAEDALASQERAIAAGFLALGAAHEFKNTLSLVKLAAHHGLVRPDSETKDSCLRRIVEHTMTARDSALDVLDRMASTAEEPPCVLDARRDLSGPLRRAGAALRGEGIVVELAMEEGVSFRARRSAVEQIVLGLVHNAAESYLRSPSEETRAISVLACTDDDWAVIDVRDAAGGVQEDLRARLFSPSVSGSCSTGLGLYLARNLARASGGNVDYLPLEGGSSFRLTLPRERS